MKTVQVENTMEVTQYRVTFARGALCHVFTSKQTADNYMATCRRNAKDPSLSTLDREQWLSARLQKRTITTTTSSWEDDE